MLTNDFFTPGKLSIILDGGAGSSGKGKIGSYICTNADNWQFCCNAFAPQAGHWTKLENGKTYFYQTLNSCAYQNTYEKMYIGPGGMIELPALFREIEENNVKPGRLGIHPLVSILQDKDAAYERGEVDLDGTPKKSEGTMKRGSTCHGVGANKARKILRRPDTILAKDVIKLRGFLCDTDKEIMDRLDSGQAGLLELAQGFQLSYLLKDFYPYCTSRNVTVAAGLDDMMIPPFYAGNVLINFRTYPIRISNFKYIDPDTGKHLIWEEVQRYNKEGKPYQRYEGNSGPGYPDQVETTWEQVTKDSGSPEPIIEMTSVTKLPRRVFTFSRQNLQDSIRYNRTHGRILVSINFMNYVDYGIKGLRIGYTPKAWEWLEKNVIYPVRALKAELYCLGTGEFTEDTTKLTWHGSSSRLGW